ncbi:hypothetical protein [Tahibacter amnicola]|uniref:Uncharacterized protein n=1 Tax=Tahibacter amnicola TaxID=2976241 RepID=A0ABY6BDB3_9GAMM|nr:hypothetical protein [Tahibacter amnicola]UXI68013.1 hypothetical protein N4264_25350 [Tahibacter amnicola]
MRRPDQDRFDAFARYFDALDPSLTAFAEKHGFALEKNVNRAPSRILRRQGGVEHVIGISLDGDWQAMALNDDLPLAFGICGHHEDPVDRRRLFRAVRELAVVRSREVLIERLPSLLKESLSQFEMWTETYMRTNVPAIENWRAIYGEDM